MSEQKITDQDYLSLSAMLKARETRFLTRDRMDRMLDAGSFSEAARSLVDCGYEDMSGMKAGEIDAALSRRRRDVLNELSRIVPQQAVVDVFRMKYDYHNAKVLIKAEGAGTDGARLLSESGRVSPEALTQAFREDDYRFVPLTLGKAMQEAKSALARTGNPQTADFILDRACFAELADAANGVGNDFLTGYVRLLADSANLRAAVRTVRMGRDQEFLLQALVPQGSVSAPRAAQAASGGESLAALYAATPLKTAAALGAEAAKGGTMTRFELACDNAVTAYLRNARFKGFGPEAVVEYLALVESEITAVRMILSGLLSGIAPDVIRERLREIDA